MKNEIVKHDPENSVIDAIWIWLSTNPPDDYDPGVHSEDSHNIPRGGHSVKTSATDILNEREWNNRPSKPSWLSAPLLWIGFFTMFVISPVEAAIYQHWLKAFFIAVLGCVVVFIGDGCR